MDAFFNRITSGVSVLQYERIRKEESERQMLELKGLLDNDSMKNAINKGKPSYFSIRTYISNLFERNSSRWFRTFTIESAQRRGENMKHRQGGIICNLPEMLIDTFLSDPEFLFELVMNTKSYLDKMKSRLGVDSLKFPIFDEKRMFEIDLINGVIKCRILLDAHNDGVLLSPIDTDKLEKNGFQRM